MCTHWDTATLGLQTIFPSSYILTSQRQSNIQTMKPLQHLILAVALAASPFTARTVLAQSTNSPAPDSAGDSAWRDLQSALRPPTPPAGLNGGRPSPEQIQAYREEQGRLAAVAADKAREFLQKYPDHPKAAEAKRQQARMLETAVGLGNKSRADELAAIQAERLNDPNTPEEDRFRLRSQQLVKNAEAEAKTSTNAAKVYEKIARQLIKEFPKRSEPYQFLLSVAGDLDESEARAIFKEISAADVTDEIKDHAKGLAKKFERVGKPLEIKFKSTGGQEVDLQAMKGKVVLVDFWATWCGPCVKELPNVKAAYAKLHEKGFEIVGISFDDDRKKLDDFVAKEKMAWPQYFDGKGWSNELGREFGINSIPAMWLIDKKGVLRELNARANLESKVEKLLAEK
jgi:thiol-disulfide isomerase/thioredoxin